MKIVHQTETQDFSSGSLASLTGVTAEPSVAPTFGGRPGATRQSMARPRTTSPNPVHSAHLRVQGESTAEAI